MSNSFSNKSIPSVPSNDSSYYASDFESLEEGDEGNEAEYVYIPDTSLDGFNVSTQCVLSYSFVTLYVEPNGKTFMELVVENAEAFGLNTDADSLNKINVRFASEYLEMDKVPEVGKIYSITSTHETKGR